MNKNQQKQYKRYRRHKRVRAKAHGTAQCPRLAVFKSNRYMYAQLIDDDRGMTLASSSTLTVGKTGGRAEQSRAVGADIARQAHERRIERAVFDRGGFDYSGVIATLADAARGGGLNF